MGDADHEYVNSHGPLPVTCWAGNFGYPLGTVTWSAAVESQAALAAATGELSSIAGYLDLVETAADLVTTPGDDILREVVYGTPGEPPAVGSVVTVTTRRQLSTEWLTQSAGQSRSPSTSRT